MLDSTEFDQQDEDDALEEFAAQGEEALEIEEPPALPDDWASAYRPVGWIGDLKYEDVLLASGLARAKRERGEPLSRQEIDTIACEEALRDCYATRAWVWDLAAALAGIEAFDTDPFANPWAKGLAAKCPRKLDGFNGRDGLAATADGRPKFWRGACPVNGPHSCVQRWVGLCAAHGARNVVAAVCPSDGTRWYQEIGLTCDIEVLLGRLNYDAPPGLPAANNSPRGSSLLIWAPALRDEQGSTFRAQMLRVDIGARKKKLCVARPGLGTAGRGPSIVDM